MRRLPTRNRKRVTTPYVRPDTGTKFFGRRHYSRTRRQTRSTRSRRQSNVNSRLQAVYKPRRRGHRSNNRFLRRRGFRRTNGKGRSQRLIRDRGGNNVNSATYIRHRVMGSRTVSRSYNRSGNGRSAFQWDFERFSSPFLLYLGFYHGGPPHRAFVSQNNNSCRSLTLF